MKTNNSIFVVFIRVSVFGILGMTLSACGIIHNSNRDSSGSTRSQYTVLAPATVPPVIGECSQTLNNNGGPDYGPLKCGEDLNVQAWNAYKGIGGDVMSLGRDATAVQLVNAMCFDYTQQNATGSEEVSAATLAGLYYGWYSLDQVIIAWSPSTCNQ